MLILKDKNYLFPFQKKVSESLLAKKYSASEGYKGWFDGIFLKKKRKKKTEVPLVKIVLRKSNYNLKYMYWLCFICWGF